MTREFDKDLTIMVAGSGNVTMQHLEESMAEWIFGPVEEREVHVIMPVLSNMGGALRNLVKLGTEWEFKFTIIHPEGIPMTKDISALPGECFVRAEDERAALETGLELLTKRMKKGDEVAFIHAYNPENTYEQDNPALSDFEIIGDAKNYQWLSTLNLCEGLVDSFEGYKSTDEILKEERLQREFDEKQRAEEAAEPAAAKKAPAPRKRAAKKVEPQESKPLVQAAEKALEEHSDSDSDGYDCACGGQTLLQVHGKDNCYDVDVKPDPRNELSADVPIVIGPDIQEDIREAHAKIEKRNAIAVSRDDLVELSENIKQLTGAFGSIMDTFTRILKDG